MRFFRQVRTQKSHLRQPKLAVWERLSENSKRGSIVVKVIWLIDLTEEVKQEVTKHGMCLGLHYFFLLIRANKNRK